MEQLGLAIRALMPESKRAPNCILRRAVRRTEHRARFRLAFEIPLATWKSDAVHNSSFESRGAAT